MPRTNEARTPSISPAKAFDRGGVIAWQQLADPGNHPVPVQQQIDRVTTGTMTSKTTTLMADPKRGGDRLQDITGFGFQRIA